LCSLVRPGGLLYFPTTFDGNTAFQPEYDPEFDRAIEASYHQAIDQRVLDGKPSGDSRAGRRLFAHDDRRLTEGQLYRELLNLIYRLLFLMVAEERRLLYVPDTGTSACHEVYIRWYGI